MSWTDEHRRKRWSGGTTRNKLLRNMTDERRPVGENISDFFFDNGNDALLVCSDILDLVRLHDPKNITITFNKDFLSRIIMSHISYIREVNK